MSGSTLGPLGGDVTKDVASLKAMFEKLMDERLAVQSVSEAEKAKEAARAANQALKDAEEAAKAARKVAKEASKALQAASVSEEAEQKSKIKSEKLIREEIVEILGDEVGAEKLDALKKYMRKALEDAHSQGAAVAYSRRDNAIARKIVAAQEFEMMRDTRRADPPTWPRIGQAPRRYRKR